MFVQNIYFYDITNEIKKNENFEIIFWSLINDMNINVNLFDKKIVNEINFAIVVILTNFVFDVKRNVDIAISLNVCIAISHDVNISNLFASNLTISVDFFW